MNVLLTGATGFIGRNIAAALADAGHRVAPLSRRLGVDFARMLAPADWRAHLEGIDVVVNSVGIIGERGVQRFEPLHTTAPSALFKACLQAGIRRVVQISALGADCHAFCGYQISKRLADDCLRGLDLDWFVLRPSLVYGAGGTSTRMFMRLAALPVLPVVGDGCQVLQPVHVSDLVATVMRCLTALPARQTLDVVGPTTISYADWLKAMRRAQGKGPARVMACPVPLAMILARAASGLNPLMHPDNLRMLQAGSQADVAPLVRFLGRRPLAVEPQLFLDDAAPGSAR